MGTAAGWEGAEGRCWAACASLPRGLPNLPSEAASRPKAKATAAKEAARQGGGEARARHVGQAKALSCPAGFCCCTTGRGDKVAPQPTSGASDGLGQPETRSQGPSARLRAPNSISLGH